MTGRTRDDFEYWLASVDDFLDEFIAEFSQEERNRLDYSPASLDVVEAWILKTYPDTEMMFASTASRRVNRAACYIGETFRKTLGGKWDIRLDDPRFVFVGLPIIVTARHDVACPLTLATATADRRTGNYLRRVLENHVSGNSGQSE